MRHFNRYKLNANYVTDDGINLIDPDFQIIELYFDDVTNFSSISINWKDLNHDINRPFNTAFLGTYFPTVEFIEGQLLQIPEFSSSTIINE